jgi:transcriptional regulator with XRE-family HTH domain
MTATPHQDFVISLPTEAGADEAGPHPVDRHVGLHIRMRRKALGISQERLAESLGLTFQQVQKYERGANRVSASKLWEIARALRTNVSYFYEGLESEAEVVSRGFMGVNTQEFLLTPEGMELAATFPRVRRPGVRRKVLDLVRAMADMEAEDRIEAMGVVK